MEGSNNGSSRTQEMIDALKNGAKLSVDTPTVTEDSSAEVEPTDEEQEVPAESAEVGIEEEAVVSGEDADNQTEESDEIAASPEESLGNSDLKAPASAKKADIAEINITDDKGRRKIKLDYSDKDKITKYVQLAYGARKWQKERDDFKRQLDEKVQMWDKFEGAWKQGYRGLINTLEGSEDAFDKIIDAEVKRRQELADMTPVQRQNLELEERARKQQLETDKLRLDYEKKLNEIKAKEEEAAQKELESRIHPAFERYRFAGKLGDNIAEHEFDTMLWTRTMARLEQLPEDTKITQGLVDKEFRTVSQMMSKHIKAQAEKEVKKTIEQKKMVAAQQVQAAAKRGVVKKQGRDEVAETIRSGNIVDGLSQFFSLGGKVK